MENITLSALAFSDLPYPPPDSQSWIAVLGVTARYGRWKQIAFKVKSLTAAVSL